ncbi:MAG: mechanosensitive ion channel domain-containing protein [bacterium]
MSNILWSIFLLLVFLVVAFSIRELILRLISRFSKNDKSIVDSFRFFSFLWIITICFIFIISLGKSSISLLGLSDKIVNNIGSVLVSFERFFIFVLIVSFYLYVADVIIFLLKKKLNELETPLPNLGIFYNLLKILIGLIGLITGLWYLNIPITPLITTLGIGGFAISLALQGVLSNFFAGMNIVLSRIIYKGDYIKIDNLYEGYVEDISWFSTKLITKEKNEIMVPNSKIINSVVINYKDPSYRYKINIPLSLSYECDLDKVEEITMKIARQIQKTVVGANPDFEPIIRFSSFCDYSINMNVILEVTNPEYQFTIIHEFIKALRREYEKQNVKVDIGFRGIYKKERIKKE